LDSNYQNKMDKALSQLRSLEIDKALILFYQLLETEPCDIQLIERIYPLELRKKSADGFVRLSNHIFSQDSMSDEFHHLFAQTYSDLKTKTGKELKPSDMTRVQIYNLFYHFGQTHNNKASSLFAAHIKKGFSEDPHTPIALMQYCEQLIDKKEMLKAKKELEFLMIYYAEASTQQAAEKLIKRVRASIC